MRRTLSVLTVLLLAGPLMAGPLMAGGKEKKPPSLFPVLDSDPKLRVTVTLDSKPETIGSLLAAISKKAGIQVACQGDFLGRKIYERVTDQEVREVMTQIAVLANGWWLKRGGVYWLFDEPNKQLRPFLESGASTQRALDLMGKFCQSLTNDQWAILARRGLTMADMTGPQQGWFVSAFNQEYGLHPQRYTVESWLAHTGAKISYDAPDDALVLWIPRADENGVLQKEAMPFLRVPVPRRG